MTLETRDDAAKGIFSPQCAVDPFASVVSAPPARGYVAYHSKEPLVAFAARFALADWHASIGNWLADRASGLSERLLWRGHGGAQVAALANLPADAFVHSTPVRLGGGGWRIGGQTIRLRGFIDPRRVWVCDDCLDEQARSAPVGAPAHAYTHFTVAGMIRPAQACPIHGCMMGELTCDPHDLEAWADGGYRYRPEFDRIAAPLTEVCFSRWIAGRLGLLPRSDECAEIAGLSINLAIPVYAKVGSAISSESAEGERFSLAKAGLAFIAGRPLAEALDEIGRRGIGVDGLPTFRNAYGAASEITALSRDEPALRPFAERLLESGLKFTNVNPGNFSWLSRSTGGVGPFPCTTSQVVAPFLNLQPPKDLPPDLPRIIGPKALGRRLGVDTAYAERLGLFIDGCSSLHFGSRSRHRRCVLVLADDAVERFLDMHISLDEVQTRTRLDRDIIIRRLAAAHVEPILPNQKGKWRSPIANAFFPRAEAERVFDLD